MRIGIITYHAVYNFGANLQALSTFYYLKKKGHEPILIDFSPTELEKAFDKTVPTEQANMHKSFIISHFILTKRCRDSKKIADEINRNSIDAVIIGSDAVVQHHSALARLKILPSRKKILIFRVDPIRYETNFPNPFWGEFIEYLDKRITVVMMSVSCQNTDYRLFTRKEKRAIKAMIEKITYITVRDKRTQEMFLHISEGKCFPEITPDPVFAFNDNVPNLPGKQNILEKFGLPDKYIILSFNSPKTVSENWILSFKSIAEQNGFQIAALAMPGGITFANNLKYEIDIPIDPLDWYCIIKYSSAYIGEKMHPIIISLHNSIPFFSFDHYGILKMKIFLNQKASKIYQILDEANLLDYRHSITRRFGYQPPAPEFVLKKIQLFDKEKCSDFAGQMQIKYKEMMIEIVKIISGEIN